MTEQEQKVVDNLIEQLNNISPELRIEVFVVFCKFCGSDDPRCQCWNDE